MKTENTIKKSMTALVWLAIMTLAWQPAGHMIKAIVAPCLSFLNQSHVEQISHLQSQLGIAY
jgi:hypothetical protein